MPFNLTLHAEHYFVCWQSFLTCIGRRDRRVRLAVEHMFVPVVQGALAILLAVGMLALSDFQFVVR